MSVHGEYSRALEAMIHRLRSLPNPNVESWITGLEAARVGAQPDLSAAARESLRVLASIAKDSSAQAAEGLHDPETRLEMHCRAILGE
jgi:hypothetical protein